MTTSSSIWRSPLVAVLTIIGLFYLGWRADKILAARREQEFIGRGIRALTEILSTATQLGTPITIEGDAPGAPRRATIHLVRGSGADSTHAVATIGLIDTLSADTVGGWVGLCVSGASILSLSLNRGPEHLTAGMPENAPTLVVSMRASSEEIALIPVCVR